MMLRILIMVATVMGIAHAAVAALPPHVATTTEKAHQAPAYSRTHPTHRMIYHR